MKFTAAETARAIEARLAFPPYRVLLSAVCRARGWPVTSMHTSKSRHTAQLLALAAGAAGVAAAPAPALDAAAAGAAAGANPVQMWAC